MVGPPDQEMTAIEKVVCYTHRSQEQGRVTPHRTTQGSSGVDQETEGERKLRAFAVVLMGDAGSAGLGLAPLDNFSGFWGVGPPLVVWYRPGG